MTLQEICRILLRRILRKRIEEDNPTIGKSRPKKPKKAKRETVRNRRRVNVVPMSMGMMILGNFDDSDSEDGPSRLDMEEDYLPTRRGEHSSHRLDDSEEEDNTERREEDDVDEEEGSPREGMPDMLQQMADMQRRFYQIARRERQRREEEEEEADHDQGIQEDMDDVPAEPPPSLEPSKEEPQEVVPLTPSSSSSEDMDTSPTRQSLSHAIPITPSSHARNRCSSSTSVSTSYTSGIGTCSSVEEQHDLDLSKEMGDHSPTIRETPQNNVSSVPQEGIKEGTSQQGETEDTGSCREAPNPALTPPNPDSPTANPKHNSTLSKASDTDEHNANLNTDTASQSLLPEQKFMESLNMYRNPSSSKEDNGGAKSNGKALVQHFEDIIESDEENEGNDEAEKEDEERGRLCRPPCSLRCDHPRLAVMESSNDNLERADDSEDEPLQEEEEEEPQLHYKQFLMEKVELLPIPVALRQYLLFYRS